MSALPNSCRMKALGLSTRQGEPSSVPMMPDHRRLSPVPASTFLTTKSLTPTKPSTAMPRWVAKPALPAAPARTTTTEMPEASLVTTGSPRPRTSPIDTSGSVESARRTAGRPSMVTRSPGATRSTRATNSVGSA